MLCIEVTRMYIWVDRCGWAVGQNCSCSLPYQTHEISDILFRENQTGCRSFGDDYLERGGCLFEEREMTICREGDDHLDKGRWLYRVRVMTIWRGRCLLERGRWLFGVRERWLFAWGRWTLLKTNQCKKKLIPMWVNVTFMSDIAHNY